MSSPKKYTPLTIKKRVDHLQPQSAVPEREPAVCKICGAVYRNKRWVRSRQASEPPKKQPYEPPFLTICPACEKKAEELPGGVVYLRGKFLSQHWDEVEATLLNEADRTADKNATARIIEWSNDPDGTVTITTTTEHLAQRLGRSLKKAFHGDVRYDFSHENKLVRVYWERD